MFECSFTLQIRAHHIEQQLGTRGRHDDTPDPARLAASPPLILGTGPSGLVIIITN